MSRRTALLIAGGAVAMPFAGVATAAPAVALVYVREVGCPYCREWDARIGPVYGKTPEARRAPIREIEKRDVPTSSLKLTRPIRYTPTFVLTIGDAEIGRIEGYPGEEFFWARLDKLLELLPAE
ncbi:thioredoxin family protein [Rhodoplanes sp.]|uniref:thioredoxin family protein n=1 Tax=Rhodoplanes sp. TaxID=1968906 RepID=UPI0025DA46B2|nr:thioredoxin family protein [Rhodoplanes sp.]